MPPKKKFTKEQIIDAAFLIAKEEGLENITIRKVANQLGSSIAPIYVNFETVDELQEMVIKKTQAISNQMLEEQNSGNPFLDIGVASLRFAKEYSVLFRDLVMKPNSHIQELNEDIDKDLVSLMESDPILEGLTKEELNTILLKMRIFQTGLSVMVANGIFPKEVNDEQILQLLMETGTDVVFSTRHKKGK